MTGRRKRLCVNLEANLHFIIISLTLDKFL